MARSVIKIRGCWRERGPHDARLHEQVTRADNRRKSLENNCHPPTQAVICNFAKVRAQNARSFRLCHVSAEKLRLHMAKSQPKAWIHPLRLRSKTLPPPNCQPSASLDCRFWQRYSLLECPSFVLERERKEHQGHNEKHHCRTLLLQSRL